MEGLALSPVDYHTSATLENIDEDSFPVLESANTFSACIRALQKSPSERKNEDFEAITDSLRCFKYVLNSTSSSSDPERAFFELAKKATYQQFSPSEVVFHKGDLDDNLYFVLKGSAAIFNEVAGDVFKVATILSEEPKVDKPVEVPLNHRSKLLSKGPDDPNKTLFQPKMTKKLIRRFTSVGDVTIPDHNNSSMKVIPTVHDVKKVLSELYSFDNSPGQERMSYTDKFMRLNSPDSPTRAERESKKKILLYKLLLRADKEKNGKYVRDGQFLYQLKKTIGVSQNFGEMASKNAKVKTLTAIASDELHVICFKADDYASVFQHNVGNAHSNIRFLEQFFPDASYPKLLKLLDLFEECEYPQRQKIFEEDTPVDALYLIKEGEIQLIKSLNPTKFLSKEERIVALNIRKKCCIATVSKGEALGEEDFFFEELRHYTGVVSSVKTVVLRLSKQVYSELSEVYKELFDGIRKIAKAKIQFKKEHVKNVTQQAVQSAQQIEDFKNRPIQILKNSPVKISDKEASNILEPKRAMSLVKSRSGSPTKQISDSPSGGEDRSKTVTFGEAASRVLGSNAKPSKEVSEMLLKLPVLSPKAKNRNPSENPDRSLDDSPINLPDKKKNIQLQLKPCATEPNRAKPQVNKTFQDHRRSRNTGSPSPFEGSSLYREAVGNVKRRKPVNLKRENNGPMSNKNHDHRLYLGELERSVQSFTKSASKPDLIGGYISVAASPLTKLRNDKNGGIVWDSLLGKESDDANTRLLVSALVKEKVNLRLENDLIDRYRLSKLRDSPTKMIRTPQMDYSTTLLQVRSQDLSLQVTKSGSPLPKGMGRRLEENDSHLSLMYKRDSQHRLDDMLAVLEPESFDAAPVRTGFKPSKVKSVKMQFRATLSNSMKAKRIWDIK